MDQDQYFIDVKGVILDQKGKILLLKKSTGKWDLPGGLMEHGESFHDTLQRECREEIGVNCKVLDSMPWFAWPTYQKESQAWFLYLCFRVELDSFNFKSSDECQDYAFFTPDNLNSTKTIDSIKPIEEWLKDMIGK